MAERRVIYRISVKLIFIGKQLVHQFRINLNECLSC
jgi:hypothetical protein